MVMRLRNASNQRLKAQLTPHITGNRGRVLRCEDRLTVPVCAVSMDDVITRDVLVELVTGYTAHPNFQTGVYTFYCKTGCERTCELSWISPDETDVFTITGIFAPISDGDAVAGVGNTADANCPPTSVRTSLGGVGVNRAALSLDWFCNEVPVRLPTGGTDPWRYDFTLLL